MASSLSNSPILKTIELYEKKDTIKNLWRNVLIVGIEDLLKKKEIQIKFNAPEKYSLEEMWFDHEDFDLICEYSQLAPKIVRKRVFETIERIRNKYVVKEHTKRTEWMKLKTEHVKKLEVEIEKLMKQKAVLQDQLDKYIDK